MNAVGEDMRVVGVTEDDTGDRQGSMEKTDPLWPPLTAQAERKRKTNPRQLHLPAQLLPH